MSEALIIAAKDQAFWAWDEAEETTTWCTRVQFSHWGFAERFIETAGMWLSF